VSAPAEQTIEEVEVTCYPSDDGSAPAFDPSNEGETYFRETVSIGSDLSKPISVFGEVDMGSKDKYECDWSFNRQVDTGFELDNVGAAVNLYGDAREEPVDNMGELRGYFHDEFPGVVPEIRKMRNGRVFDPANLANTNAKGPIKGD
jgi:hypothetical protein